MSDLRERCDLLASKTFNLLELLEVANISPQSFVVIRKRVLDIGNDIKRLAEKEGEDNGRI